MKLLSFFSLVSRIFQWARGEGHFKITSIYALSLFCCSRVPEFDKKFNFYTIFPIGGWKISPPCIMGYFYRSRAALILHMIWLDRLYCKKIYDYTHKWKIHPTRVGKSHQLWHFRISAWILYYTLNKRKVAKKKRINQVSSPFSSPFPDSWMEWGAGEMDPNKRKMKKLCTGLLLGQ